MKILILTGKFGMGHISAAEGIRDELKYREDLEVEIVDLIEYIHPSMSELIYGVFSKVANSYHGLYNTLYKVAENKELEMKMSSSLHNKKIGELLDNYDPELIISTLPLCSKVISNYKEINDYKIPLITCITDVSTHKEWANKNTDLYLVPTEKVRESLMESGVKKNDIYIVGIPVREEFKHLRRPKGTGEKNILIMGGGLGIVPNLEDILRELEYIENLKVSIIAGNNKKLYESIKAKHSEVELVGYTKNVHYFMNKADLIISKSGGITLFESIYTETPMFVIRPFLPQEVGNAKFIEKNEIGRVIWEQKNIGLEVRKLLEDDLEIDRMKKNMRELRKEVVVDSVASAIDRFAKRGVEFGETTNITRPSVL